jgi:hypothetical protein
MGYNMQNLSSACDELLNGDCRNGFQPLNRDERGVSRTSLTR